MEDRRFKGVKELRKFENGGKLTLKQAVLAKCCDCMGRYVDGRQDCGIPECSLYAWMPFAGKDIDREE